MAKKRYDKSKFEPKQRIEKKYSTLLEKLLAPVKKEALKHTDNLEEFQAVLKRASESLVFQNKAKEIARQISTMLFQENEKSWREAAKRASRGKYIKENLGKEISANLKKRMNELFEYNTTLIVTLPKNISENVIRHVNSQAFVGKRASDIVKEIKSYFPHNTKANAKLIARTEVSKFSSALTQARAEDLGLQWYVWETSEDRAVRSSHAIMQGVLVPFAHAPTPERLDKKTKYKKYPQPYHAGNIYNCRCYMAPLTGIDDVEFPCDVYNYKKKKIERMTKEKFLKFNNYEIGDDGELVKAVGKNK